MSPDSVSFTIPVEPVAFARAGSNGKRRYTPGRQANFMGTVKLYARRAMAGRSLFVGAVELSITAVYEYPPSWSVAKRAATVWKTSRPDSGNILKLPEDAMSGIVWADDAQVAQLFVQKIYGPRAALIVCVRALPEGDAHGHIDGDAARASETVAA